MDNTTMGNRMNDRMMNDRMMNNPTMDNEMMNDGMMNDRVNYITDGTIENITNDNNSTLVTVNYTNNDGGNRRRETIRLVVGRNTLVLDEYGNRIPASDLMRNMIINAAHSSAVTRSIPPQAAAFMIRVIRRPFSDNTTIGRIIDLDRKQRSITTISDNNLSSVIRFNTSMNTRFLDASGRPMNFSGLRPGMRVQVRHASFMTASIPPQSTAFEVRILR